MNNGKTKPRIETPVFATPKPAQPLVVTEQATAKAAEKAAAIKQMQDLKIERIASSVAVANSALPVINAVIGDANHNAQVLAQIILQRNCDIAEDYVEIVISDE